MVCFSIFLIILIHIIKNKNFKNYFNKNYF